MTTIERAVRLLLHGLFRMLARPLLPACLLLGVAGCDGGVVRPSTS